MQRGFTLLEILVTIIIIAVLASIALTQYTGQRELALDKEAIANLKLIQSAQKIYRMEIGGYVACADTVAANTWLRLLLPTINPNWNFKVDNVSSTPYTFRAKAQRAPNGRIWCLDQDQTDPTTAGCSW